MSRIAVTGIGLVCPLGVGIDYVWPKLMSGMSGIISTGIRNEEFVRHARAHVGGFIPLGTEQGQFDKSNPLVNKKGISGFIKYAILAADEALRDAGWTELTDEQREYTGVTIGNGMGSLRVIEERLHIARDMMVAKPDAILLGCYGPFFIPGILPNLAAGNVSMTFGLKGPNRSVNTACASGLYSVEDGAAMIRNGDAKVVVAGSTEGDMALTAICGFDAMNALSRKYNEEPHRASRPYDKNRDGFVMSEGAGILILEEFGHAQKRGARIYAEYLGAGLTSDAYHISAPSGEGSERAMRLALKKSGVNPEQIGYIGTHATSTNLGDKSEVESMSRVFGKHIYNLKFSAVKSLIGHMLGAASGAECAILIKSLAEQKIPPTINVDEPDTFMEGLDYVPHPSTSHSFEYAMKNSFGFGGSNAAAVFRRIYS